MKLAYIVVRISWNVLVVVSLSPALLSVCRISSSVISVDVAVVEDDDDDDLTMSKSIKNDTYIPKSQNAHLSNIIVNNTVLIFVR
jgi:hypothetical protein